MPSERWTGFPLVSTLLCICALRVLRVWRRDCEPLLDNDPSQQRIGSENCQLVFDERKIVDGSNRTSRFRLELEISRLLQQDLGGRGVERGRAHKMDHANEEHECRNRDDEQPIAPDEIEILAQVE